MDWGITTFCTHHVKRRFAAKSAYPTQKPRLFLFMGHAFFGWGFGEQRVPACPRAKVDSVAFMVHVAVFGTVTDFSMYLALALQHVPNIFNIIPESALHAPVVASASRRVPRPPRTSRLETHSDRALSGVTPSLFVPACPLLSVSPNTPVSRESYN